MTLESDEIEERERTRAILLRLLAVAGWRGAVTWAELGNHVAGNRKKFVLPLLHELEEQGIVKAHPFTASSGRPGVRWRMLKPPPRGPQPVLCPSCSSPLDGLLEILAMDG